MAYFTFLCTNDHGENTSITVPDISARAVWRQVSSQAFFPEAALASRPEDLFKIIMRRFSLTLARILTTIERRAIQRVCRTSDGFHCVS